MLTEQQQETALRSLDGAAIKINAAIVHLNEVGDLPPELGAIVHRGKIELSEVLADLRRARQRVFDSEQTT